MEVASQTRARPTSMVEAGRVGVAMASTAPVLKPSVRESKVCLRSLTRRTFSRSTAATTFLPS